MNTSDAANPTEAAMSTESRIFPPSFSPAAASDDCATNYVGGRPSCKVLEGLRVCWAACCCGDMRLRIRPANAVAHDVTSAISSQGILKVVCHGCRTGGKITRKQLFTGFGVAGVCVNILQHPSEKRCDKES